MSEGSDRITVMHELHDIVEVYDRYGRERWMWICYCGKRGEGSATQRAARTAFARHAKHGNAEW